MKELTIKEKAQRYDEAIERAKAYQGLRSEMEIIFPELKESEGERIWIINYLSNRILNSTIIAEKENLKKAIAWLKKQGEQKPWSEEDENYKDALIGLINEIKSQPLKRLEDWDSYLNWLKSLKVRVGCEADRTTTWKPSDEQMDALDEVYKTHSANNVCRHVLFNLMNDLKKLREE